MEKKYLGRLVDKILRRRSADDYRRWLLKYGRVVEGRVIDSGDNEEMSPTIYYCYHISNVRYESSQVLTPEQGQLRGKYFPGASVSVRFDPRHPGAAIVE